MSTKHQFTVEGINCVNCVNGIKSHLLKKGLDKVYVNIASGLVRIESEKHTSNTIKRFISEIGYKPRLLTGNPQKSTKLIYSVLFSAFLSLPLLGHMFVNEQSVLQNPYLQLALATPVLGIGYFYFFRTAFRSVINLKPNMNVLILMGATSAYIYSLYGWLVHPIDVHQFLFFETSATIITLVLLGNYIEKRAIQKTTTALSSLQKLQVTKAFKEVKGKSVACLIDELVIGDVLIVNQGEAIPIDGEIIWGSCAIDESMITGESSPAFKSLHQKVVGGTILLDGNIKLKVSSTLDDSVLSNIIEMVCNAQEDKPQIQKLGDRISHVFVPLVLLIALLTFTLNFFLFEIELQNALLRAIAVLVISCPCAMGLATPTAVMVGVGRAAKNGILIKGGSTIELFSKTKKVVFDKTGTLTNGAFEVSEVKKWKDSYPVESIIYELEKHSAHPVAKSLCKHFESFNSNISFTSLKEIKGMGFEATDADANIYQFGSAKFIKIEELDLKEKYQLFLTINSTLIASLAIKDQLMDGAKDLITYLHQQNLETVLLSGDSQQKCNTIAKEIGISSVYAEQSPKEKIELIERFTLNGNTTMFGDGINDAPALTKATTGISHSKASDVAVQSASIVLLNQKLSLVEQSHKICKHTYTTIKQNLFWAFAYNLIAIPLAAMGYLSPIFAALTMAFSDIVVIGNSIRLKYKNIDS